MATPSRVLTCSYSASLEHKKNVKPVKIELIKSLKSNDPSYLTGLVLPKVLRIQLSRGCSTIVLVDTYGRSYDVKVEDVLDGYVKLCDLEWPEFVQAHLLGDFEVRTLCFRLLTDSVLKVYCFNKYGLEPFKNPVGQIVVRKCLVPADDSSVYQQYLPLNVLEDLNEESKVQPSKYATVVGPLHDAEVEVVYQLKESNEGINTWEAVGFQGNRWTTFVVENQIEPKCIMMFTNMRNGCFKTSVFTSFGVGVQYHCFKPCSSMNYVEQICDSTEDMVVDEANVCRDVNHKHVGGEHFFVMKLPYHILTRSFITIPSNFAEQHQLHHHRGVILLFGKLRFKGSLIKRFDNRREDHENHLLIKCDWNYVLRKTALLVGDKVRFTLNQERSHFGSAVVFNLC